MTSRMDRVVLLIGALFILVDLGALVVHFAGDDDGGGGAKHAAAAPSSGWPTNGGSLANQRYSPLTEINADNVSGLKGVWRTHLGGSGVAAKYSAEAQPVIDGGMMYVITGADDVFAVDIKSGKVRWRYKADLNPKITSVCCGWTSRGVAVGDGKVYLGRLDGRLVALDKATGKEAWSTSIGRWQDGYTITSAPLFYKGRVYTGISGGEFQIRGRLTAVDAETGKIDWRFYTVPGPGETGGDSWPKGNDSYKRGGAPVWQTPAVDPELGMLYFSTGNASPDDIGHLRGGDNLFSASIVAIDAETGKYRWHFQQVHHDIWDYDSPSPVVLFDAKIDGKQRKALVQVNKTGWPYFLDRETGKPIFDIEERPVPQDRYQRTSPTQPFPSNPAIVSHDVSDAQFEQIRALGAKSEETKDLEPVHGKLFVPPTRGKMAVVAPSPAGGVNWPPTSYNAKTGMLYACGLETAGGLSVGVTEPPDDAGASPYLGSVWTINGFRPNPGVLAAIDTTTGEIAWKNRFKDACFSGAVSTAGNLVFTGRNDGHLQAFDARNGKQLWSFQTGAGANNTATVFEQDGKEYVAFYAGGSALGATAHGDNLWLFGLDGKLGEAKSGGKGSGVQHAGEDESRSQPKKGDPDAGESIFSENCSSCHGADAGGGNGGPSLKVTKKSPAEILVQIEKGGGGMPGFESQLTPQQLADVQAYVVEVSGK